MSVMHIPVEEIKYDERDYDSWLVTLTEASTRLDVLQTVVDELRQLCAGREVVASRQVLDVLDTHGVTT